MIQVINSWGGSVVKFVGDALIVVWTAGDPTTCTLEDGRKSRPTSRSYSIDMQSVSGVARQAASCCVQLLKELDAAESASSNKAPFRMHIGIDIGHITCLHVGGEHSRWFFLVSGHAVRSVGVTVNKASAGQLVVTGNCWNSIGNDFDGVPCLPPEANEVPIPPGSALIQPTPPAPPEDNYMIVTGQKIILEKPKPISRNLTNIGREMQLILQGYLPTNVMQHLSNRNSAWMNELRKTTVVFICLPQLVQIDGTTFKEVQMCVTLAQSVLDSNGGVLREFVVDDKGSVMVAAFGLPPFAHVDDPTRAVKFALQFASELGYVWPQMKAAGLPMFRIGVTTGDAYCGIVGSNERCEYAVIGSVMNLASRIMGHAPANSIMIDLATYKACGQLFDCRTVKAVAFKGFDKPVELFRVLGIAAPSISRVLSEVESARNESVVGCDVQFKVVTTILDGIRMDGGRHVIYVEGETGVGKTCFVNQMGMYARRIRGMAVLRAELSALQRSTPLFILYPILRQCLAYLMSGDMACGEGARGVVHRAVLSRGGKDLEQNCCLEPWTPVVEAMSPKNKLARLFYLSYAMLSYLAQKALGLVIIIDNMQYIDASSAVLVDQYIRKLPNVVLVFAHRPGERRSLPSLEKRFKLQNTTISLKALNFADTELLLCRHLGIDKKALPPNAAQKVYALSSGNGLYITEIATAWRSAALKSKMQKLEEASKLINTKSINKLETLVEEDEEGQDMEQSRSRSGSFSRKHKTSGATPPKRKFSVLGRPATNDLDQEDEESVHDMIDSGELASWLDSSGSKPLASLITARMDALDLKQQMVLKACAVQGIEFQRDSVAAVLTRMWNSMDEMFEGYDDDMVSSVAMQYKDIVAKLDEYLDDLVNDRWIVPVGDDGTYAFCNVAVQDGVYNVMLGRQRKELHAHMAEYLENVLEAFGGQDKRSRHVDRLDKPVGWVKLSRNVSGVKMSHSWNGDATPLIKETKKSRRLSLDEMSPINDGDTYNSDAADQPVLDLLAPEIRVPLLKRRASKTLFVSKQQQARDDDSDDSDSDEGFVPITGEPMPKEFVEEIQEPVGPVARYVQSELYTLLAFHYGRCGSVENKIKFSMLAAQDLIGAMSGNDAATLLKVDIATYRDICGQARYWRLMAQCLCQNKQYLEAVSCIKKGLSLLEQPLPDPRSEDINHFIMVEKQEVERSRREYWRLGREIDARNVARLEEAVVLLMDLQEMSYHLHWYELDVYAKLRSLNLAEAIVGESPRIDNALARIYASAVEYFRIVKEFELAQMCDSLAADALEGRIGLLAKPNAAQLPRDVIVAIGLPISDDLHSPSDSQSWILMKLANGDDKFDLTNAAWVCFYRAVSKFSEGKWNTALLATDARSKVCVKMKDEYGEVSDIVAPIVHTMRGNWNNSETLYLNMHGYAVANKHLRLEAWSTAALIPLWIILGRDSSTMTIHTKSDDPESAGIELANLDVGMGPVSVNQFVANGEAMVQKLGLDPLKALHAIAFAYTHTPSLAGRRSTDMTPMIKGNKRNRMSAMFTMPADVTSDEKPNIDIAIEHLKSCQSLLNDLQPNMIHAVGFCLTLAEAISDTLYAVLRHERNKTVYERRMTAMRAVITSAITTAKKLSAHNVMITIGAWFSGLYVMAGGDMTVTEPSPTRQARRTNAGPPPDANIRLFEAGRHFTAGLKSLIEEEEAHASYLQARLHLEMARVLAPQDVDVEGEIVGSPMRNRSPSMLGGVVVNGVNSKHMRAQKHLNSATKLFGQMGASNYIDRCGYL